MSGKSKLNDDYWDKEIVEIRKRAVDAGFSRPGVDHAVASLEIQRLHWSWRQPRSEEDDAGDMWNNSI